MIGLVSSSSMSVRSEKCMTFKAAMLFVCRFFSQSTVVHGLLFPQPMPVKANKCRDGDAEPPARLADDRA
ncbi:hypothetical protein HMPREF2137_06425 [Hoylesella buccalis DNF00853]|uniref:Uncharacterized protein n=1 Tax=Hoylesella buccalis DNF00853 TaxID=1401074 RepID=A0A095ZKD0_9BACT|nr:hypothetical protein HMPREF2137_06425 [Hoylesella buccalis DNF00853]